MIRFVFLPAILLILTGFAVSGKETDPMKGVAKELQDRSRKARMDRRLHEYIEDRLEYLEYGLEQGTINAAEEKKIRRSIRSIRSLQNKMRKKGTLSPEEQKKIYTEINRCYRLIWFASRKEGPFLYDLFGRKFYLKDPWQSKWDRSSLSEKEMQGILETLNRVWRLRNRMKNVSEKSSQELKKRVSAECERILLEEYFDTVPPPSAEKNRTEKAVQKKTK